MGLNATQPTRRTRIEELNRAFNEGRLKLDGTRAAKLAELNRRVGNMQMAATLQKLAVSKLQQTEKDEVSIPRAALGDLTDVLKGLGSLATESLGKRILGPAGTGDQIASAIRGKTGGTLLERPGDALATVAETVLEPYAKGELSPLEQQIADHVARQGIILGTIDFMGGFSNAVSRIKEVAEDPSTLARKPTSTALAILGPIAALSGGAGAVGVMRKALRGRGAALVEASQSGGALPQATLSLRTRALNRRFMDASLPSSGKIRFIAPAGSEAIAAEVEAASQTGSVGFRGSQIVPKVRGGGTFATGISRSITEKFGIKVPDGAGVVPTEGEALGISAAFLRRQGNTNPSLPEIRAEATRLLSEERLRVFRKTGVPDSIANPIETELGTEVRLGAKEINATGEVALPGIAGVLAKARQRRLSPLVDDGLQARIITRKARRAFDRASPSETDIPGTLEPLPISAPTLDVHFGNILLRKRTKTGRPAKYRHVDPGVHGPGDLAKSGFDIAPNLSVRDIRLMATEHRGHYLTKRWSLMEAKAAKADFGRISREARSQGAFQGEINEFARFFNDSRELQLSALQVWSKESGFDLIDGMDTANALSYAGRTVQGLDDMNVAVKPGRSPLGGGGVGGPPPGTPGRPTFGQALRTRGLGAVLAKLGQPINAFEKIPELFNMVPEYILAQGRHANQAAREIKFMDRNIFKGMKTRELLWMENINNGLVTIDDVVRNFGDRGQMIWDRSRMLREQQSRLFREMGGNPAITSREHYFPRIFEDPLEIARILYDAHGGNPAVLLSRTDIHVPESVIANQMRPRTQLTSMAKTISDPRAVQKIYIWQALRRKYLDPLAKKYNDDVLAKVNERSPVMAARAADYIRDALGIPTTAEIALRVKMQGLAARFTEKFPQSPRAIRELVKTFGNTTPSRLVNYVTGIQFLSKFAGKVAFIPVNLGELLSNIPRQIGLFNTIRGFVDAANPWSRGGRELAAFLTDTGLISESPLIDTALWGKWRTGPQIVKDIAAFPVTWSERLNLKVATAGSMRKIVKEMGKLPRERFILESIREMQKARPGFFRAARPQVLRRPAGRFLQQFQSYSYFIVETIGRDIANMARARSFKELGKAAAPTMRLYMLGWAYQAYVESVMGIDLRNQMGLGWFPFVFWNSRTREWVAKNPGELIAGPNLGNFFQVYENLFQILQDDDAAQQLKDPETYKKLILPMLPQLKQALEGETLREKIIGRDIAAENRQR